MHGQSAGKRAGATREISEGAGASWATRAGGGRKEDGALGRWRVIGRWVDMGVLGRGAGRSTDFGQRGSARDVIRKGLRRDSQEPQEGHPARAECGQWGSRAR